MGFTRRIRSELLTMVGTALVVLAIVGSAGQPPSTLVVAVAAMAITALLGFRAATAAVRSRELTIGSRARHHRESLGEMSEPSHPGTPGKPRSRAPSTSIAAV